MEVPRALQEEYTALATAGTPQAQAALSKVWFAGGAGTRAPIPASGGDPGDGDWALVMAIGDGNGALAADFLGVHPAPPPARGACQAEAAAAAR